MSRPVAITATGMITSIGNSAEATCAAIRSAIDNNTETRFIDDGGEWLMAAQVELESPWRGQTKLVKMAAHAIQECLDKCPTLDPSKTPVMLCLSEKDRPGRVFDSSNVLFLAIEKELGVTFNEALSQTINHGHVSAAVALKYARQIIYEGKAQHVLVVGTDSLLVAPTLAYFMDNFRLLTSRNSNGFIPGEAGAAMVVEAPKKGGTSQLLSTGLGFSVEKATIDSDEPLRAEGLTQAIFSALAEANKEMYDMDFRVADVNGAQYHFKETSLALSRTLKKRKEEFDIWHPSDCVGEVGASLGIIMLASMIPACEKGYTKGHSIMSHFSCDDGRRAACVLQWNSGESNG